MVSRTSVTGPRLFLTSSIISVAQDRIIFNAFKQCSHCSQLYIRETDLRLGDRIEDQLNNIRKNDLSKSVSRHFDFSNYSISNFVVFSLSVIIFTTKFFFQKFTSYQFLISKIGKECSDWKFHALNRHRGQNIVFLFISLLANTLTTCKEVNQSRILRTVRFWKFPSCERNAFL